jgi:hypothetical protein
MWDDGHVETPKIEGNTKYLERELSSITAGSEEGSDASPTAAHAEFLKEKHLQNTLRTWAMEMQLPAHDFALGCSFLHQVALGKLSDVETILEDRPSFVNFRDYDRRTGMFVQIVEYELRHQTITNNNILS